MPDADAEKTPVFLKIGKNRAPVFPAEGCELGTVELIFGDGPVWVIQVAGSPGG